VLREHREIGLASMQPAAIRLGHRRQVAERQHGCDLDRRRCGGAGECGGELGGVLVPLRRIGGQRALAHLAELRILDQLERRLHRERIRTAPAGEQVHEHEHGGEQIGARVDAALHHLLGRHVRGRAAGGLGRAIRRAQARQAEIDEDHALGAVLLDDDRVRRLDVGVHEAGIVRRAEAGEELACQLDRALAGHRAGGDDHLQILAVEQLHGEEQAAVVRDIRLVDAHHVRVVDATDAADLVDEQAAVLRRRIDVAVQDLERHVALDRELARAIHGAERAARDDLIDAEPTGEHGSREVILDGRVAGNPRAGAAERELRAAHVPQAGERWWLRDGLRCVGLLQQRAGGARREVRAEARHRHRTGALIERLAAQAREQTIDERATCLGRIDRDQVRRRRRLQRAEPASGATGTVRGHHHHDLLRLRGGDAVVDPRER
jgi:hypothetical protein